MRLLVLLLLLPVAAIAAPLEVTIEDMNKARDAYVLAERDKAVTLAVPTNMVVTMTVNDQDYVFGINSGEAGFAEILAAVKAAAAARVAAPKEALPVIVKEPVKETVEETK